MADVLILTHIDYCPPAHLAQVLLARGCSFDVLRVDLGELRGYDLERPRAVAVMGGPMSVNDPLPWIADEVAALQRLIAREVPIIGHCLGGQLLAKALGASIRRMPYTEAGWQDMQRHAQVTDSPWLAHLPEPFSIFQWHGDTFALPEGAQALFSSRWCDNQAFAWGDKVLALQGHPEMTEPLIECWLDDWAHLLDERQPSQQSLAEMREQLPEDVQRRYLEFIKGWLAVRYAEYVGKEIQTAYLESYSEYGQNIFDRYVTFADYWIQDEDYRDPETGAIFDRATLNGELEKIEKPAGIANPKDFRNEIVNFVLRARAQNEGRNPNWTSYEKLRDVIEKKMFSSTEELLPVISFNAKASDEDRKKHENFVTRMVEKGYTPKQVRLLSEWYLRVRKAG
mgnify:CR=1 FL=1